MCMCMCVRVQVCFCVLVNLVIESVFVLMRVLVCMSVFLFFFPVCVRVCFYAFTPMVNILMLSKIPSYVFVNACL